MEKFLICRAIAFLAVPHRIQRELHLGVRREEKWAEDAGMVNQPEGGRAQIAEPVNFKFEEI